MKGRFAPSPSGRMHLGNVYAALLSWLSARSQGGGYVLRIEDIDPQRSRKEYAEQIKADLQWLGLDWDEEYVQSERFGHYEHYLARLKEMNLTYPCYCTKADILATQAPHETDGHIIYKGTCRNLPPSTKGGGATRLIVPDRTIRFTDGHYGGQQSNLATDCGDFIIRRKDGAWAYQLAVVVDDALNGITEVVRGRDLLPSVPQQLYLYELLQLDAPRFIHIPLLINTDGQRLCKRDKSLDLGVIRSIYSAEQVIGKLAHIAGITETDAPVKAKDLVPLFDWNKIPTRDITVSTI